LQCFTTAGCDKNIIGLHIQTILGIIRRESFPELLSTLAISIGNDGFIVMTHRIKDLERRFNVRLADIKVIDLDSAFDSIAGIG